MKLTTGPLLLVAVWLVAPATAWTQEQDRTTDEMQRLHERIEQLERRTHELERHAADSDAARVIAPLVKQLSFGGQIRVRAEYRDPADERVPGTFGRPDSERSGADTDFVLLRTRLHADATLVQDLRAYVQLQDARTFGGEPGAVLADDHGVDLHQGYFDVSELMVHGLSLRLGRQELAYGDQRLVSPLDWSNVGRAWDAVKLVYQADGHQLDAFGSILREGTAFKNVPAPGSQPGTTDDDQEFDGLYYQNRTLAGQEIDAYFFYRRFADRSVVSESGQAGDLKDHTVGAREKGTYGGFDQSLELVYQFGSRAGDRVSAEAAAAVAGVTFAGAPWQPRLSLEYDYATGDRDPDDGKLETFDSLFPFCHFYQGFMDVFCWKNGSDLALRLGARPDPSWTLELAAHDFHLAEAKDAWYDALGNPVRRDPTGRSGRHVGEEVDLTARVQATENLNVWFGWGHLFPGAFVRSTGSAEDVDWVFAQAVVSF
ncbi:MAG: alginate export family protein [Planctomycetota bacterium]